jgi:hypothetical protein
MLHGDYDHHKTWMDLMTCPSLDKQSREKKASIKRQGPQKQRDLKELVICRWQAAWTLPWRHQNHSFSRYCRRVFDSWHCRHCERRIPREGARASGVMLRLGLYARVPWIAVHQVGQRHIINSDGDSIE